MRNNLWTVTVFEFLRTITKPRFWLISLGLPLLMGAVVGMVTASTQSVGAKVDSDRHVPISFTYTDRSGIVNESVAAGYGGRRVEDPEAGRAAVQFGQVEAHVSYPPDPLTQTTMVYGVDVGPFGSSRYATLAEQVFQDSVLRRIADQRIAQLAERGIDTQVITYRDGVAQTGLSAVLARGLFLILFYLAILLLGNQMLSVTLEEKENRVSEMVLVTMHPRTLIVGKVLALIAIGLVQTAVFMVPAGLLLWYNRNPLGVSDRDLHSSTSSPPRWRSASCSSWAAS